MHVMFKPELDEFSCTEHVARAEGGSVWELPHLESIGKQRQQNPVNGVTGDTGDWWSRSLGEGSVSR